MKVIVDLRLYRFDLDSLSPRADHQRLIEEVARRAPREIIAETVNVCVHIRRDPRLRGQRRLAGLHFVRGLTADGSWDLVPLASASQLDQLIAAKTDASLGGLEQALMVDEGAGGAG